MRSFSRVGTRKRRFPPGFFAYLLVLEVSFPGNVISDTVTTVAPNLMVIFANSWSMTRTMDDSGSPSLVDVEPYRFDDDGYKDPDDSNDSDYGTKASFAFYGDMPESKLYVAKEAFETLLLDDDITGEINFGFATFRQVFGARMYSMFYRRNQYWTRVYPPGGPEDPIYEATTPEKSAFGRDPTNFSYTENPYFQLRWDRADGTCEQNHRGSVVLGKVISPGYMYNGAIDSQSGLGVVNDADSVYFTNNENKGGLPSITVSRNDSQANSWTSTECGSDGYQRVKNGRAMRTAEDIADGVAPTEFYLCRVNYRSQNNRFDAYWLTNHPADGSRGGATTQNSRSYMSPNSYLYQHVGDNVFYMDNRGQIRVHASNSMDNNCLDPNDPTAKLPRLRSSEYQFVSDTFRNVGPLSGNSESTWAYFSYIPHYSEGTSSRRAYAELGALTGWSGENDYSSDCDGSGNECMTAEYPSGPADPGKVGRNLKGFVEAKSADPDRYSANLLDDYKYIMSDINHMGLFLDLPDPESGYVDQRATVRGYMGRAQMSQSGEDYSSNDQYVSGGRGIAASTYTWHEHQSPIYQSLMGAYAYYAAYKEADSYDSCRNNNILLFYDGKEDGRWSGDVYARPEEMAALLYEELGVNVHVVIISNNAGDISQANLIADSGGTDQAYSVANAEQLTEALTTVFSGLSGDVSEVATAAPDTLLAGDSIFIASRSQEPIEGHLKAYQIGSAGAVSASVSWDAATTMTTAQRADRFWTNGLLGDVWSGDFRKFVDYDGILGRAAFAVPGLWNNGWLQTIQAYTVNPSVDDGAYLNGRKDGSFLGSISYGNAMSLLTNRANTALYLEDESYRAFYDSVVSSRTKKIFVTSDDGFLYAFDQADGALSWGWIPHFLLRELKNYEQFQAAHYMRGLLDVIDAKYWDSESGTAKYSTFLVGNYKSGRRNYAIQLADNGGLSKLAWNRDLLALNTQSPNYGEKDYFHAHSNYGQHAYDDATFVAYIRNREGEASKLVLRNVANGDEHRIVSQLDLMIASTPYVMPSYRGRYSPMGKYVYLGGETGGIYRALLTDGNGEVNTVENLRSQLNAVGSQVSDLNASDPILFFTSAKSSEDRHYYLVAQSRTRITVFRFVADPDAPETSPGSWVKSWTSTLSTVDPGTGSWNSAGTTFTADNTGVAGLDSDGYYTLAPETGIQSLPENAEITDRIVVVADTLVVPVTIDQVNSCGLRDAYYLFFKLTGAGFPSHIIRKQSGEEVAGNAHIGSGDALRVVIADNQVTRKLTGFSHAQQAPDGSTNGYIELTFEDNSSGVRGWRELLH